MTNEFLPPGIVLVIGAFVIAATSGRVRQLTTLVLPLVTLLLVWITPLGDQLSLSFLDYQLEPLSATATGRVFATIFALMAFVGAVYGLGQASKLEMSAAFAYAGAAICVTFAGDIITLFIFWEVMAVGSTLVIWAANTEASFKASFRYLMVHIAGGVVLMAGVVAHIYEHDSIEFTRFSLDSYSSWLIMVGFLVNAGAPPLSAWIADAYPEASPSGSVFLSAFTTKTAVYTLMVGFAGADVLIYVGLYMVFYGIIYALLENDMRRILAYSIVNQVGFMVTAIGIGSEMALNGAVAHAFSHIIYKALLLMSAGSVLLQTGERRCSHLGGLFQTMPITAACGIIGALAISSFPFTSGFVTKSLETSAAAYEGLSFVWFCLLAASAGVFLHAGIKFPWFVFFQKDSGLRPAESPLPMRIAMCFFAFLCIAIGVFPDPLYAILPYKVKYEPYTVDHLVTQFQLLIFAGFAFFVFLPMMKRTLTISLDFDWFYRRLFYRLGSGFFDLFWKCDSQCRRTFVASAISIKGYVMAHAPDGILAKNRPSSSMVIWVTVLLAAYLFVSFL